MLALFSFIHIYIIINFLDGTEVKVVKRAELSYNLVLSIYLDSEIIYNFKSISGNVI